MYQADRVSGSIAILDKLGLIGMLGYLFLFLVVDVFNPWTRFLFGS